MGESADSPAATQDASEPGDSSDSGSPRGFFGRILDAISGNEAEEAAQPVRRGATVQAGLRLLRRVRLSDVAVPKPEIVAVPETISRDELVEVFREHGFSRLPVYSGTLDTPVGLVHLKDLALRYGFGAEPQEFVLKDMLRPLIFAPPSMPAAVLLQRMQAERSHMALIIDEYGGVDGLVTLEDLLEEVIGEIEDEHDEEEGPDWIEEGPGQWLVQAHAPLEDFEAATGLRLSADDARLEVDTLGGLAFMLAGRVPERGAVLQAGGAEIEVVEADPRRIRRLRVRLPGLGS